MALALSLRYVNIQQRHPVLKRLQSKTTKDEHDAKRSQPALGQVVSVVLDHRTNCAAESRHNTNHQPNPNCKPPNVVNVLHERATEKCGHRVAHRSREDSPSVASSDARLAGRSVVKRRTHASRIRKHLPNRYQHCESSGKFPAQARVEASAESKRSYRTEQSFPAPRIMV